MPGIVGAPIYRHLDDVIIPAIIEQLRAFGIKYRYSRNTHDMALPGFGSVIMFRGLDDPDRLRGPNVAWCGVDELTYCKEAAWKILEQRVRHPQAKRLMQFACWTPKGFDWVYQRFVGSRKLPGHECVTASPAENLAVLARQPDYYEKMRRSYDERFYRQEVLGEYLPMFGGQVYYGWSEENKRPCKYDPTRPLVWSLDFNVDPLCSVLCQYTEEHDVVGETVEVLHEFYLRNANVELGCEAFLTHVRPWTTGRVLRVEVYGDPGGNQRHVAASATAWQTVRRVLAQQPNISASFHVPDAAPFLKDRVGRVNGMLRNTLGERRLFVDPGCEELAADFEQVSWQADRNGVIAYDLDKSNPKRTHLSDALGYFIHRRFARKPAGGPMPGVLM